MKTSWLALGALAVAYGATQDTPGPDMGWPATVSAGGGFHGGGRR